MTKKIAIVGTGISGNSAAWILHRSGHDITVFEKNDYAGGHSNTVDDNTARHPSVDTGFIVYNTATYPNFIALMDYLGVATENTDMSFAVSLDQGRLEYAGHNPFAQKKNIFSPRFWSMIVDLVRFYTSVEKDAAQNNQQLMPFGQYLIQKRYGNAFINDHLLPMAAAIWSTTADDIRQFPLHSFVRFFANHGLLKFMGRPQWKTVTGGSRSYVTAMTHDWYDRIRLNSPVTKVAQEGNQVRVTTDDGHSALYDEVIMACHTNESLAILSDATADERAMLEAFPYKENTAYLHRDAALMPQQKSAWASWNYLSSSVTQNVCVTYWMNKLQPFIGDKPDLFVTLNPDTPPRAELTFKTITYDHPQFLMSAINGWQQLGAVQGRRHIWFCGAWCGYGFHEDGLNAGLAVAEAISGTKRPWDVVDSSPAGMHATPAKD